MNRGYFKFSKREVKILVVLLTVITLLLILSLRVFKERTIYTYNGVVVTRIDYKSALGEYSNKFRFYYGDPDDKNNECRNSYIECSYHGWGNFASGYLVFNDDKTIVFLRDVGYIELKGGCSMIEFLKLTNFGDPLHARSTKLSNSYDNKESDNIIWVTDSHKWEKEKNEGRTKVQVQYTD